MPDEVVWVIVTLAVPQLSFAVTVGNAGTGQETVVLDGTPTKVGGVTSFTCTLREQVAVLPIPSVAVHVMVVIPKG